MIPDGSELLARCERIVGMSLARGADQAETYWQAGANLDVDVEAGRVAGTSTSFAQGGAIRTIVQGRVGFAYFTREDDAATAIERALAQARIGPGNGYQLPEAEPIQHLPGRWDDGIAALDVDSMSRAAAELIAGAAESCPEGNMSGGGVGAGWHVEAISSSAGASTWDRTTSIGAGASLVLEDGTRAISTWESQSTHVGSLDAHGIGAQVGQTTMDLRKPTDAEAGVKDVILLPDAASELVNGFVAGAVDGDDAMRGRSVWSQSLDTQVAHAGLTIMDDSLHPDGIGTAASDGEGLATRRMPIIESGSLRTFMFDSWTAHRHGTQSTGHASRGDFKALPGVGRGHWVVSHDQSLPMEKLLAGVDDGFLVESVLGAHTANATTGDFSITSPNVWRVRDGALDGACKDIALGGNLPEMLHRLDAVSDAPKRRDGSMVPALRFRDVQVSV